MPDSAGRHLLGVVEQRSGLAARDERALGGVAAVDEELRHGAQPGRSAARSAEPGRPSTGSAGSSARTAATTAAAWPPRRATVALYSAPCGFT